MHIKSIWNKDQGHYYFNIFLINIRINYLKITINYKCYVMIKLTVMRGLILIKQVHQKSVIIATFGISATDAMIYNDVYKPYQYCYFKH